MKLNKKVIESMTVVSAVAVVSTFTALTGSTEESVTVAQTSIVVLEKTGTAGIIAELHKMEEDALAQNGLMTASIVRTESNLVAEGNAQESLETAENSTEVLEESAGISQVVFDAMEVADAEEQPVKAVEDTDEVLPEENIEAPEKVQEIQPEENGVSAAKAEENAEDGQELEPEKNEENQEDVQPEEDVENSEEAQPEENTEIPEESQSEENVENPEETQPKEDAENSEETQPKENQEEAQKETENEEWSDQVMADVEEDMNIRTAPDETSELAGKFYRGDVAEIVAVGDEWTEITSGNVTGFVKNEYLVYGDEAYQLANEVCSIYATVNTDGLRLRSEPNEEAGIVTTASNGDRLKVDKEAEETDGWVAVKTSDSTAYVSADYVEVALNLGTALNNEEVKEKEAAKAAEEAKKAGRKPAMSASTDEVTLLGALIQCEAGSGSYEGMLAVGSVVMNRVRSGGYPGTISGVIYQAGQFPPALSGSVANVAAGGVRSACLQAAQEAINGADNTNGALQFRSASSGYGGTVIGGNVFF
ncbi:MAG: cell wall hydrolase [Lachnospiraceae bacterium]|nr:cell wall hydrolase [Lachnospiraceae bacterium]MDE6982824.1 cell wall hydrolase [Lachnospiraceae bacterium]